ncbi:pectate lyase [Stenotrophomonas sp. KCTC 12332]|nr:pectate lyase [Stenotrophomonas sp. KCTC 12332]
MQEEAMRHLWLPTALLLGAGWLCPAAHAAAPRTEPEAENMLLLQTASGGWSKQYQGKAVDYQHVFSAGERAALQAPDRLDDANIDNKATTREIRHLLQAWQHTGNGAYLKAAQRGVDYLLAAQYANGGWPQYYPDRSLYRHQITFNDDAMTRVLDLLQDIAEGAPTVAGLPADYRGKANAALQRGLGNVLATQIRMNGRLSIWAAQYDEVSLQPAKARSYELPSLAVSESVGVLRLLMRQPEPGPQTVTAIEAGLQWLQANALPDLAMRKVEAADQPSGKDVLIEPLAGARLWARFYDLQQGRPMFVNREGERVARFADIPNERRVGYAWYGVWPEQLLVREWPKWAQRHGRKMPERT